MKGFTGQFEHQTVPVPVNIAAFAFISAEIMGGIKLYLVF
jgi:hypothetical protein